LEASERRKELRYAGARVIEIVPQVSIDSSRRSVSNEQPQAIVRIENIGTNANVASELSMRRIVKEEIQEAVNTMKIKKEKVEYQ